MVEQKSIRQLTEEKKPGAKREKLGGGEGSIWLLRWLRKKEQR